MKSHYLEQYLEQYLEFMLTMHANSQIHSRDMMKPSDKKLKKIIPKGCKEYFFTKNGSMFLSKPEEEVVFECIALSDKIAQKKFDKFNKNNP